MAVRQSKIAHVLEVEQPRASLLVSGELEALDLFQEPPVALLGQRIAIRATELNAYDLGAFRRAGIQFPNFYPKKPFPRGIVGSVVIEGTLEWRGGKIVRQTRPGSEQPFRKPRCICGPVSWVLRQPSVAALPANEASLELIRAGYWDLEAVQNHLLCYVDKYGIGGLAPDLLTRLETLRSERKDKEK